MAAPEISPAIKARDYKGPSSDGDGDGDGAPLIAHALRAKANCAHAEDLETYIPIAHTLRAAGHDASEDGTGRGVPLVAVAFDTTQITSAANRSNPQPGDPCHPLAAGAHVPAVAFNHQGGGTQTTLGYDPDAGIAGPGVVTSGVRRLTPTELERLMGYPDGHTLIPWRKGMAPDGPRAHALGNSMAVPVMAWIGRRLLLVDALGAA